jgi:phytoene synthase
MMRDTDFISYALKRTAADATGRGMPESQLRGQLIRPALAYAAAQTSDRELSQQFWSGALAIQYAHEASLIHDDIVDEAKTRRGQPSLAETKGIGTALVIGDHLLTASYRLAAETECAEFFSLFTRCVERTVAGEIEQARSLGRKLTFDEYKLIAESKSGELLAASLALGAALTNPSRVSARAQLGRRLGLFYQMIDDLLDYCPATDMGKPALGDFSQKRWTWPLGELDEWSFDQGIDEITSRLRTGALSRCLTRLEQDAAELREMMSIEFGDADVAQSLIDEWIARAREAVLCENERALVSPSLATGPSLSLRMHLPVYDDVIEYLAENSKSFRFASRFFPRRELSSVARVYAFCRITDDLTDRTNPSEAESLLTEWMDLAQLSYQGSASGIEVLDQAMSDMRSNGIAFDYAAELAEGMRMDLRGERYSSVSDLRTYSYRVASVVGLWLTELAGIRDRRTLHRAEALGHAMQMTNILRDVGEDARNGRIYLPSNRLEAYGITRESLCSAAFGRSSIPHGFADLVEELLRLAERDYAFALSGVHDLPPSFQRAVAVAGHVYRGIHSEIRRNGYDTLTRRAVTSGRSKALLAARALWQLQTGMVTWSAVRRMPAS